MASNLISQNEASSGVRINIKSWGAISTRCFMFLKAPHRTFSIDLCDSNKRLSLIRCPKCSLNLVGIIHTYHDRIGAETHLRLISWRIIWLSRSSCCCRSCDEAYRWGKCAVASPLFLSGFFHSCLVRRIPHSSHFTRRMVIESHVSVYDELIYSRNEHTIYMPHPRCALNDKGPGWLMALSSKHLSCIEHLKTSHSNGFDECSRKDFHSYLHFSTGSIKICIFISLYLAQLPIIRFTSQQLNSISSVTLTSLSPSDSRFIELMRKASNS